MRSILKFLTYLRPYKVYFFWFGIFMLFGILFGLVSIAMVIPLLSILFNQVKAPSVLPEFQLNINAIMDILYYHIGNYIQQTSIEAALGIICISIIGLFLFKNLFVYLAIHYLAPVRTGIIYDLRKQIFERITTFPLSYFTEKRKGDTISRLSGDVVEIEWTIMMSLVSLIRDPLIIFFYITTLFIFSPKLTVFVLLLLPLSAFLIGMIGRSLKKKSAKGQHTLGILLSIAEETLSGMRVVKAFNAQDRIKEIFDRSNKAYRNLGYWIFRRRSMSSPLSEFMGSIVIAVVMWFGGRIVLNGQLAPSVFIAYIAMFSQIISPSKALSATYYNLQKGLASLDRIKEITTYSQLQEKSPQTEVLKDFSKAIEFKNVWFRYEKDWVLKDVNLSVKKGETVALVGASGSGKSTIADLIPAFYTSEKGSVSIDGIDVKLLKKDSLRSLLGIVPQHAVLFHDSIAANIAFGIRKPDIERIKFCAAAANANGFIEKLPDGYYTQIGEQGLKLSGGQRQRIAIARALYKNPQILIFDEATSALDAESEQLVQKAIQKLMEDRTALVIAHRLSTIRNADTILVVENGQITESGKHKDLIKNNGRYQKLVEMNTF